MQAAQSVLSTYTHAYSNVLRTCTRNIAWPTLGTVAPLPLLTRQTVPRLACRRGSWYSAASAEQWVSLRRHHSLIQARWLIPPGVESTGNTSWKLGFPVRELVSNRTMAADAGPQLHQDQVPAEAEGVLTFWFGEGALSGNELQRTQIKAMGKLWFKKREATDEEIRSKFGSLIKKAKGNELNSWDTSPKGSLALLILLDQFTRNAFRDAPEAFASDNVALEIAKRLVASGGDLKLSPLERIFVYLPFEHSESMEGMRLALEYFSKLRAEAREPYTEMVNSAFESAQRHEEVMRRFGRYPHRNEQLGRASTLEELEFLKQPGSRF